MSSNTYSEEGDLELTEKLNKLRGGPSSPSPPPIPFSDLSIQLKNEILITTSFLKSFLNDDEGINSNNPKPIVFSPTVILRSLTTMILSLSKGSSSSRIKEIIEEMENIFNENFAENIDDLDSIIFLRFLLYSEKLSPSESFKNCWDKTDNDDLILPVNFDYDLNKVIQEINSNMTNKTMGKISKMFDASSFSLFTPSISLCLGSAATFINQWCFSFPFDEPKLDTFYSNPPRQIQMIRQKEKQLWKFSEGDDWTCMNSLYGNDIARMLYIILPKEKDGLKNLIKKFDYSLIRQCIKGAYVNAIATIPTFEIESTTILNDKLKDMGIKKLFEKDALDDEIIDPPCNGLDLYLHAAKIKIDQFGTYGRDDTDDHMRFDDIRIQPGYMRPTPGCREIEFIANQPFIFFVALWSDNLQDTKIMIKSIQFAGIFS